MTQQKLKIEVQSEIGRLNAVLLHRPGAEVENMTPLNVHSLNTNSCTGFFQKSRMSMRYVRF